MQLFEFSKFNQNQRLSGREEVQMKPLLNETCQMRSHFNGKAALPSHPDSCFASQELLVCTVRCSPLPPLPHPPPPQLTCGVPTAASPLPPLLDETHSAGCPQSGGDGTWVTHAGDSGSTRVSLGFQASCASGNTAIPAVDRQNLTSDQRWASGCSS